MIGVERATTVDWFDVHGVRLQVVSEVKSVSDLVGETYDAFRIAPPAPIPGSDDAERVEVRADRAGVWLSDLIGGESVVGPGEGSAGVAALNCITRLMVRRLAERGTFVVHAASLAAPKGALILSGPSGRGKTTLALGLLGHGMSLLSDEMAVVPPNGREILPYHRSLHIRPGTPELLRGFDFVTRSPPADLGLGNRWTVTPSQLTRAFPRSLGGASPLRGVVLLEPLAPEATRTDLVPLPAAIAAVELSRATPALEFHVQAVLTRLGGLLKGIRCARLTMGGLDEACRLLAAWLDED